jgi:CO/xanthine dehydrogenase Mo-binding subunit
MRGMGEQGVIGIPAALANAVSRAIGRPINKLPVTAERTWRVMRGEEA